jgi:hypothetical protein
MLIMTCGLRARQNISLFTQLVTYAYRMHIEYSGMYAAFIQNKSIFFENQAGYTELL